MTVVTAQDGTQILDKDWGPRDAPPLVFHRGPVNAELIHADPLACIRGSRA